MLPITQAVPQESRVGLYVLIEIENVAHLSIWGWLKQEPASLTITQLRVSIDHFSKQRKLLLPHLFSNTVEGC